jgi:hypothetical protein
MISCKAKAWARCFRASGPRHSTERRNAWKQFQPPLPIRCQSEARFVTRKVCSRARTVSRDHHGNHCFPLGLAEIHGCQTIDSCLATL